VERFALAALFGYLLGSIPTAYLAVRWKSQLDIREAGSGNVGTVNSFEVTKSARVAGIVLVVDFAKGAAAVALVRAIFGASPDPGCWGGLGAVIGHNYPVWLGGKGGRGLATAAGAALLTLWGLIPVWVAFWAIAFTFMRKVNPASAVACLLTALTVAVHQSPFPGEDQLDSMTPAVFTTILMAIIMVRLIDPVRSYIAGLKRRRSQQ
jgi:glycerol-3-phosphate acyltransferase PlsY